MVVNPASPRIFAYIKMHKEPPAAWPIVEKLHSPTYYLEKHLARWCNAFLAPYPYNVSSSADFLMRLRQICPSENSFMTVLDFESLYPSLNLNATCLVFYRFLTEHTPADQQDPALLCEIAYLICHELYFKYNGVFYKQHQGVPIGSPMAGVLAELVVREVELQLSHNLSSDFLLYSKYVEDLF